MHWRAGMMVVVLATVGVRADEPGAPLESTKQELKSFQKQQAQGAGETLGKLTGAMPQLQTLSNDSPPLPIPTPQSGEADLERKRASQANWLLEGMNKLDKTAKAKESQRTDLMTSWAGEAKARPAPGDRDYFLTLYSEQQKNAEARAGAQQSRTVHSDPMKPFLQGWLADSPVRGKFFDELIKRSGSETLASAGAGTSAQTENNLGRSFSDLGPGGQELSNVPAGQGSAPAHTNPYMQGLDLSGLQDLGAPTRQLPSSPAVQGGPLPPPTASAGDPLPSVRAPDKKQPLSTLSDDKKYFPQLNKF